MPVTAVGARAVIGTVTLQSAAVMECLNKICTRQLKASQSDANRQSTDNYTYSSINKLMFHTQVNINISTVWFNSNLAVLIS